MAIRIEHVNITVPDAARLAALMEKLFGWHVRWQGPARDGGCSVHVGTDSFYISLYTPPVGAGTWPKGQPLNHIGVECRGPRRRRSARDRGRADSVQPWQLCPGQPAFLHRRS